jgi:serine/threonine protein kinase
MPTPGQPDPSSPEDLEFEIDVAYEAPPARPQAPAGTQTPPPYGSPGYGSGAYASPYASGTYGSGIYDSGVGTDSQAMSSHAGDPRSAGAGQLPAAPHAPVYYQQPEPAPYPAQAYPQALPGQPQATGARVQPPAAPGYPQGAAYPSQLAQPQPGPYAAPPQSQVSGANFSIAPSRAPGAAPAARAVAPETLPPGTILDGKYQILVKLGQGGMGAVYRARHLLLNKDVALKVIAPHLAQDPSFKARFFREAKVAMEFVHRYSIPVRDFGQTRDGLFFMTMDFSTGRSLRSIVETEGALPAGRAVRIVRMILEALTEAHRKRIVHRDLKPDNVMVEEQDGEDFVKVLDFGLAKMVSGDEDGGSLATAGQILGTPAYMSPEQGCGEEVDHRADLYACGVILYQLLSGRLPFTGPTSRQLIMKHVSSPVPPLSEANPHLKLPAGLEDVVMKALAKEKNERFQSADQFAQALARYAQDGGTPGEATGKLPMVQLGGGAYAGQETVTGETYIPEDVSGSLTGHTIDRYKILAPIAEGGMGAVYQAEHLLMHRECAFKVIKGGHLNDEEVLSRFQKEAQVSAKFKHPSAVEVYDFGRMGKKAYFMAMELVKGKPLTKRIEAEGGLPLKDVVEIGVQLLEVIDAAHKAGIVHRDLKPDNVMLQEVDGWKNQVKLLDFGIAKLKDAKGEASKFNTMTGVFFGTPQYSSPEQCKGEPVDGRSDIYSIGVILFEMLTGKLPFESESPQGFLVQHLVTPPKKLSEAKPGLQVPAEVEAVIMKALEKAKENRFATAHEMADALKRAAQIFPAFEVGDHGIKLSSGSGFFGFGQFREMHTSKKFVLAVALLGIIVATLLVFFSRSETALAKIALRTEPGGVSIAIYAHDGTSVTHMSGEDGAVVIPPLKPGHYRAIFAKPGFQRLEQELNLEAGETVDLPIRLVPESE